jgi:hypothetical protein
MSTTSEIVERLREGVPFEPRGTFSGKLMFEAAARLSELERENARLREALETIRDTHIPDQPMADDSDEAEYARKHHTGLRIIAQQALAGSGEK